MVVIEVLVGMISSGKSTYARRRADEGALVIAHDSLTQMLHGGAYRYEEGLRECYRKMEESLVWRALDAGRDVVVDRTHLTRESRRRWVRWAADHDSLSTYDGRGPTTPVVAVAFSVEDAVVHARRRFAADPRGRPFEDWLKVAEHHAGQARLEPLGTDEGFAEVRREGCDA